MLVSNIVIIIIIDQILVFAHSKVTSLEANKSANA